jgi:hypothetical protein
VSIADGEDIPSGDLWKNWQITASGYAGVWARDNTREEIFNAFKRKETYATTGPRIAVRFFGGWKFSETDSFDPNFVDLGYSIREFQWVLIFRYEEEISLQIS